MPSPPTQNHRRLLLVTKDFPYPGGEQFLETEMEALCRHFAVIDVVPLKHAHRRHKPRPRAVPPEVRIFDHGPSSPLRAAWRGSPAALHILAQALQACRHAGIRNPMTWSSILAAVIRRRDTARRLVRTGVLGRSDAVYSYWADSTAYLLAELRAVAGPSSLAQPFVTRAHGHDLWAERLGLEHLPFQLATIRSCDHVCPCSERGAAYLRANYPSYADRIKAAYLGVAPQTDFAAPGTDGVLRLLTCSEVIPLKRLQLFAEAFGLLRRPAQWTHIGDGPEGGALRERCTRLSPHLKVAFPGIMPNSAVLNYYRSHPVDLFVNVSVSEGIPVTIMEALSFGVPALATDVGGVAELVRPEVGRLLPADLTVDHLAACLEQHAVGDYDRRQIQQWQRRTFSTANYEEFVVKFLRRPA